MPGDPEATTKCRDGPSHCQVLGPNNFCIIAMTFHHNTMPPRYRLQRTNADGGTAVIVWPPTAFVLSTPMLYYFGFTDEPLQHGNDAIHRQNDTISTWQRLRMTVWASRCSQNVASLFLPGVGEPAKLSLEKPLARHGTKEQKNSAPTLDQLRKTDPLIHFFIMESFHEWKFSLSTRHPLRLVALSFVGLNHRTHDSRPRPRALHLPW
ncbi:hypothetical protein GGI42DRAFT_49067 [Trichoderma sp. SZMC 28013]